MGYLTSLVSSSYTFFSKLNAKKFTHVSKKIPFVTLAYFCFFFYHEKAGVSNPFTYVE
jgi:hypothetical protein